IEHSSSLASRKTHLINIIESALSGCLSLTPKLIADFLENLDRNLVQYPINEFGKQLIYQWIIKLPMIPDMLQKFIKAQHIQSDLLPLVGEENKLDQNSIYELGFTQLHIAIIKNNRDLLVQHIEKGADVNQPDKSGNTPVILAAVNNNFEAMILLIAAG